MFQQFIKDSKLNGHSTLVMLAIELGVFLIGMVITCIVMAVDGNPDSWFCLGTLLAAFGLLMIVLLGYGFSFTQEFQLAISMGQLRRAFFGAYFLRVLAHLVLGYGLLLLLHLVELNVYPVLYPGLGNDYYFWFLTDWHVVLPVVLGIAVWSVFMGALFARFGKKSLWGFWVVWMLGCILGPRMADTTASSTGLLDRAAYWLVQLIRTVPTGAWIGIGVVVLVGLLAISMAMSMKQMVK